MYFSDEVPTEPQPIALMDWVWLGISLLVWVGLARWLLAGRKKRADH